ncbi:MAG TPA: hypothetical protein VJ728_01415, partial [Candidatus Binataceae bacterium]|nr:hypothetical protein [Candidatus Binataceae bacterium]
DVARDGRTVIFVSHNMAALQGLCQRAVLVDGGRLLQAGSAADIVSAYLKYYSVGTLSWERKEPAETDAPCFFSRIWLSDEDDNPLTVVTTAGSCCVNLEFRLRERCTGLQVSIGLFDAAGYQIFGTIPQDAGITPPEDSGAHHMRMSLPDGLLLARQYVVRAALWHPQAGVFERIDALSFAPEETALAANEWRFGRPGLMAVRCDWSVVTSGSNLN